MKITIPTELNELTLGAYQDFVFAIQEDKENETDQEELVLKAFDCFTGISHKTCGMNAVLQWGAKYIEMVSGKEPRLIRKFSMNVGGKDIKFGFIPDLYGDEFTYDEGDDASDYFHDPEQWHKFMAVVYRPIEAEAGDKYRLTPYESTKEYADIMKDMPLDVALSAMGFFGHLGNTLLTVFPSYLEEQVAEMSAKLQLTSEENGEGLETLTRLQEEMYSSIAKLDESLTSLGLANSLTSKTKLKLKHNT